QQLYAEYAKYNSISFERSNNYSALLISVKFYNSKNYAAAIPFFETYLKQHPANTEIALALNICKIETGLYDNAINGLDSIIAKQNAFLYQAQWLKALAYLKQDKKDECKTILKQIPGEADTYEKAQSLLKKLK
ncbi:MAG: tetratricopeptide repeat protein, partial [Parafilimonas sp.]